MSFAGGVPAKSTAPATVTLSAFPATTFCGRFAGVCGEEAVSSLPAPRSSNTRLECVGRSSICGGCGRPCWTLTGSGTGRVDEAGGGAGACRTCLPPSTVVCAFQAGQPRGSGADCVLHGCRAIPRRATGVAWRVGVAGIFRGGAGSGVRIERFQRRYRGFLQIGRPLNPRRRPMALVVGYIPGAAAAAGDGTRSVPATLGSPDRRGLEIDVDAVVWWQWAAMMFLPGFSSLADSGEVFVGGVVAGGFQGEGAVDGLASSSW